MKSDIKPTSFKGRKSLTQVHQAPDCDINRMMEKATRTGVVPVNARQGIFADVSSINEYHFMLNTIRNAESGFLTLPVGVRDRFRHDPANLLAFLDDPRNAKEAESLGLVVPKSPVAEKPPETPPPAV